MPVIDTVPPSTTFPATASAVVIGAGIIGIATALELQARGLDVVVLEKGEVAAEQSSRNWGWCRQMGRDPRELPLIKVSLDLWRGMAARIGADVGYHTCGIAYLADNQAELAQHMAWHAANTQSFDLPTRVLTASEAQALTPGCRIAWRGGLYTADDGRAEPFMAVPAMARAFQARGGLLFTGCAARGVERQGGRVCSVVTERDTITTGTVVLAGGYWSRRFLANLGISFPQLGVVNSVLRTASRDIGHGRTFAGNRFAVRQRQDGGFTVAHNLLSVAEVTPAHVRHAAAFLPMLLKEHRGIRIRLGRRFVEEWRLPARWALDQPSPFEAVRVLDPAPYTDILDDAMAALQQAYPAFAGIAVAERWAGMIDSTPDAVPVVDHVAELPGLFLASGFSGHGFGLGPGAGRLAAEMIVGERPCVDPAPFRFSRFHDGTKAAPTTGV